MSTNKTMQQLIDDVIAEAENLMADCYREGNSFYRAVRVSPSGESYSTIDPSRCVSEGEYYRRVPHTLTAWEAPGTGAVDPSDGIFYFDEAPEGDWLVDPTDASCHFVAGLTDAEVAERHPDEIAQGWVRATMECSRGNAVGDLINDYDREEIERVIREWVEAGNYEPVEEFARA